MVTLAIESTQKTPDINFDSSSGQFSIAGMSCAEYALDFYSPVLEWLDNYIKTPQPKTTLNIQFKYFNTSSAKCILQVLERFAKIKDQGGEVEINWFYDKNDEQMLDDGENYSEIIGIPFQLKQKN